MRRLDHIDQVFVSQGIELPPSPDSPASEEQDQEEEHSEELTQQEAPPETQTTTEVQQPPEVPHDIPKPRQYHLQSHSPSLSMSHSLVRLLTPHPELQ